MSTRTESFMTQRGGGGPSSPWQRQSAMETSNNRQDSRPSISRGYAIPRGGTSANKKSHRPNFAPPAARQEWRDRSSSSYHRNDVNWNRNRDRDRDYRYDRRDTNEYRPNGFGGGHRHPGRYENDSNDRDRNTSRGRGYENNKDRPSNFNNNRLVGDGSSQRDERGRNYNEPRDTSRYNGAANANRSYGMTGGSNHYDDNVRNRYRDSKDYPRDMERKGRFGQEQHARENIDFQRREPQRSYPEKNCVREYRHSNDSGYHPSRYPTDRNHSFQPADGPRDEYKDRGERFEYQRRGQPEQRWQDSPPTASRGKDGYNSNDRADFSGHRMGMCERRWEDSESRSRELSRSRPEETTKGYFGDSKSRTEWSKNSIDNDRRWSETYQDTLQSRECPENGHVERTDNSTNINRSNFASSVPPYSSPSEIDRNKSNNSRKREREDNAEAPKTIAVASKTDTGDNATTRNSIASELNTESKKVKLASVTNKISSIDNGNACTTNTIERNVIGSKNDKETSTQSTANKVIPTTSSQTKTNDKPTTKSIPVKAFSSSIKKHQLQAKPKQANKLGIPMRWLKPKAKPKSPVKKILPKLLEDTSKSSKIPLKQKPALIKKSSSRPSSPSNRLVTDSSEASSSLSNQAKKPKVSCVPTAIVTKKKTKKPSNPKTKKKPEYEPEEEPEDEWDSEAESEESDGDDSDSDIDDNEALILASKMRGVPASASSVQATESNDSLEPTSDVPKAKSPKLKIRLSSALKLKMTEATQCNSDVIGNDLIKGEGKKFEAAQKKLERRKKKREKLKALSDKINDERPEFDQEKAKMEIEEERRKREEAKPLTAKELRKILRDDTFAGGGNQNNWVRRSRRQPNMNLLNSKPVRILVDKLKYNDVDMRVLKMKKYINDPNTPFAVIDAILNAMEENTNCEALYIQNFNEGMRDEQVIHLLRILQQPSCNIWCLNIGENYNVSDETWERFTKGLMHTKITHMYASEHTITSDMKEEIRFTIRENRKKHDMHINPNNLDVIIQCTHCWWNPINAKVLRPFLKKKGYEHVLKDKEGQGLQGSKSMAPTS